YRRANGSDLDQTIHAQCALGELADRYEGTVDGNWLYGDIDARAVREASVDHRRGFVDPPANAGDNLANDAQEVSFVLETNLGLLQLAEALDKAEPMRVDENISDCWIPQQRLDRAVAGHLVDDLLGKYLKLALIERNLLGADVSRHIGSYLLDQLLARQLLQHRQIELVDDSRMQLELLVEQSRALRDQILVDSLCLAVVVLSDRWPRSTRHTRRCPKQETHVIPPAHSCP